MKTIAILLTCVFFSITFSMDLAYTPQMSVYDNSNFIMTQRGLMIVERHGVAVIDTTTAQPVLQCDIGPDRVVSTAGYLPRQRMFAICSNSKRDGRYLDDFKVSLFLDNGRPAGRIVDENRSEAVFFRQILSTSDERLFLNVGDPRDGALKNQPLLTEVGVDKVDADSFHFTELGNRFSRQLVESRLLGNAYKLRWLAKSPSNDRLYVVDELQPRGWLFEETSRATYERGKSRPFDLVGYVAPYDLVPSRENQMKWYYSFSRVTGFYAHGDGFIIGYHSPNREHPWYAFDGEASKDESAPFFVLYLQVLDDNLQRVGPPGTFPGGFFAGMEKDVQPLVLYHEKEPSRFVVERVELVD